MDFRSPLARVKGLGSAHQGSHHWMLQRMTAIVLAILFLWFVFSFAYLVGQDYYIVKAWIARPLNTVLMVVLMISAFYHAALGLQVILEDYLKSCYRLLVIIGMKILMFILATAVTIAILRAALGG